MAPRNKNIRTGQGFSLFQLTDVITEVTESLANALSRQGVDVDQDMLLLQIQNVVQMVGQPSPTYSAGNQMFASEDPVAPYSVAGDLLAIAYEKYNQGETKTAIKKVLSAMNYPDFADICMGLTEMNSRHSKKSILANEELFEEDDDEDENETAEEDEDETDDVEDDNELDEDDIEDLVDDEDDEGKRVVANDDGNSEVRPESKPAAVPEKEKSDEEEDEDELAEKNTEKNPNKSNKVPMGGTSSSLQASERNLAEAVSNSLSLSGDNFSRRRAEDFVRESRKSRR